MKKLTETRCRWLIRQEMWRLRATLGDAAVDDNLDEIDKAVWALAEKNVADDPSLESSDDALALLKLLIQRAVDAIEQQLRNQVQPQASPNG